MGSNLNKWDLEKMQQYCDENAKGYVVLEEKRVNKGYQNQQWALLQCPNGHEPNWIWWNHFTHDRRCKYCKGMRITKALQKNIKDVIQVFADNGLTIDNVDDYKGVDSNLSCHDNLGYGYFTNVSSLKMHNSSFKFNTLNPHSLENIKLFCKLERPEYEIVSDKYIGIKEVYTWKYNGEFPDGREYERLFECTADGFINGYVRHPAINRSSLELSVCKILDELHIDYETQKTFDECVDKNKLRYDFYFKIDGQEYCIETDGEQHFKPIDFWGGVKVFEETKKRDEIKNKFCSDNGIVLIRIPFNKIDNAKNIILDYLKSIASSEDDAFLIEEN